MSRFRFSRKSWKKSQVLSLGFVVFGKEVDLLDVASWFEGEVSVFDEPLSKVEVENGICNVSVVVVNVVVKTVRKDSIWGRDLSSTIGRSSNVTWENIGVGSKDVVNDWYLREQMVHIVGELDITKIEVVASIDQTSHFLALS